MEDKDIGKNEPARSTKLKYYYLKRRKEQEQKEAENAAIEGKENTK